MLLLVLTLWIAIFAVLSTSGYPKGYFHLELTPLTQNPKSCKPKPQPYSSPNGPLEGTLFHYGQAKAERKASRSARALHTGVSSGMRTGGRPVMRVPLNAPTGSGLWVHAMWDLEPSIKIRFGLGDLFQ